MVTELQRQFGKSHILRRAMLEWLEAEGAGRLYRRALYESIADVYGNISEAQIKYILFSFLQCYDITPDERAEALHLLELSETALTEDQRRQMLICLQTE